MPLVVVQGLKIGYGVGVKHRLTLGSLRKYAKDGPLSVAENSRALLAVSLGVAMVKNDDTGSFRMVKSGTS